MYENSIQQVKKESEELLRSRIRTNNKCQFSYHVQQVPQRVCRTNRWSEHRANKKKNHARKTYNNNIYYYIYIAGEVSTLNPLRRDIRLHCRSAHQRRGYRRRHYTSQGPGPEGIIARDPEELQHQTAKVTRNLLYQYSCWRWKVFCLLFLGISGKLQITKADILNKSVENSKQNCLANRIVWWKESHHTLRKSLLHNSVRLTSPEE